MNALWAVRQLGPTVLWAIGLQVAVFAAEDSQIIFPAKGNRAETTAASSSSFGAMSLVVGIALAGVGGWLVWRGRQSPPATRLPRQLTICETRSLGGRQYLVVVAYEDKKFLLGVCPGRIDLLVPLDGNAKSSADDRD